MIKYNSYRSKAKYLKVKILSAVVLVIFCTPGINMFFVHLALQLLLVVILLSIPIGNERWQTITFLFVMNFIVSMEYITNIGTISKNSSRNEYLQLYFALRISCCYRKLLIFLTCINGVKFIFLMLIIYDVKYIWKRCNILLISKFINLNKLIKVLIFKLASLYTFW